jgi:alkylation response protein AidB-like acyl-CoA dehydrogenase
VIKACADGVSGCGPFVRRPIICRGQGVGFNEIFVRSVRCAEDNVLGEVGLGAQLR